MGVPFSLCCDATAADVPSRSTALCDPFALLLPKRCLGGNRETGVLFCILCLQRTKKKKKNRKRRGKKIEWNEEEKAPITARKAKMDFSKSPLENKAAPHPGHVSYREFCEGKAR